LKFGTLVGIYRYYRAQYKNLSAKGCLGKLSVPTFVLDPLHISETNQARKLKFGKLVGTCIYRYYVKICLLWGVWGSAAPNFDFETPSISWKIIELGS